MTCCPSVESAETVRVESVVDPKTLRFAPIYADFATPTPPRTCKAPVVTDELSDTCSIRFEAAS